MNTVNQVHTAATIHAPMSGHPAGNVLTTILVTILIVLTIISVIMQRRALNKIAFGRSMFISFTCILTGFIISLLPNIASAIIGIVFYVIGFGFLFLMAVKSAQHMKKVKTSKSVKDLGNIKNA